MREKNNNVIVSEMRLQQICMKSGMSPKVSREIVESINTDDVKENLKNNIADAVKNGAYGSPFFMCERSSVFWKRQVGTVCIRTRISLVWSGSQ